jgi:predicted ATPase
VRDAIARHDGLEVDTQGDSFFVAFASADGALAAAEEAQAGLAAGPMRVRIGVHTGPALATEQGYVGFEVHRAARIAAAGHGGQVLVSAATAALIDRGRLRDLGEHRFKDLAAPQRVYQLGDGDFPPVRSLYRTNLPVPATTFLGRERELAELIELLSRDRAGLLTLTGPGGTGKTRLALQAVAEASERFPDGVTWVGLAALREPGLVPATIARALGLQEEPDRPPAESLVDALAARRALLLLDNAEHLLPGVAAELAPLRRLPELSLLVTSRERLQVEGERVYPVPPLHAEDAVSLFLERGAALGVPLDRSPAVFELCRRLDDLPLALELAAARTPVFSPEQLLERLGRRLDLLKGGRDAEPRQQTLRATIAWSHELLSAEEQQLFHRLSVFAGGCSLDAAEQVAGADPDALQSLIEKSLVRRRETELGPRYWLLETIREFAAEELSADAADEIRARHAEWFLALAEAAEADSADNKTWGDRLALEVDNLRAALDRLRDAGSPDYLRLAAALGWYWADRLHVVEGRDRLADALARHRERGPARASGLVAAAELDVMAADIPPAVARVREALEIWEAVGDEAAYVKTLVQLAWIELHGGERAAAERTATSALERAEALGDPELVNGARIWLAQMLVANFDADRAEPLVRQSLEEALARGDVYFEGNANHLLADCALIRGECAAAEAFYRRSLELAWQRGDRSQSLYDLEGVAMASAGVARAERTLRLAGAVDAAYESFESQDTVPFWLELKERWFGVAREALGEEAASAIWEEGRALAIEDAVKEALASEA